MKEKKILFASDLDNTLLISAKNKKKGDICVEINNGVEQSFMTKRAAELLSEVVKKTYFIPVTTRSMEQYRRINLPFGIKPEYAVVLNGATLLKNDETDAAWAEEVKSEIEPWKAEFQKQLEIFESMLSDEKYGKYLKMRIVEDSFVFLYCAEGVDIEGEMETIRKKTKLKVEGSGRKIYLFPPNLTKGRSLSRLKERINPIKSVAAGDSTIDLSMLEIADIGLAAKNLRKQVSKSKVQPENAEFSEWMLTEVLKMA